MEAGVPFHNNGDVVAFKMGGRPGSCRATSSLYVRRYTRVIRHFRCCCSIHARCFQRDFWFLVDSLRTNLRVAIYRCSLLCRLAETAAAGTTPIRWVAPDLFSRWTARTVHRNFVAARHLRQSPFAGAHGSASAVHDGCPAVALARQPIPTAAYRPAPFNRT
jgi:hypothetical protein